jgi:hypothetical protein
MTSDLPGSPIDLPDDHPDGGNEPSPDSPPEPGTTAPGSAAEEEKILDEGETQTRKDSA